MYKQIPHNPYVDLKYVSKEIFWLPCDTEELYQTNLKENYTLLKKYNWIDSSFTYKFNSEGFRCEDFTDKPSIVFLGCSSTIGIGLPVETTWPTLISNELKLECYNLGIGGSSNDTAFRLAYYWIERIKPKLVIFCQSFAHRIECFDVKNPSINQENDTGNFIDFWLSSNVNGFLNKTKNALAITKICENLGIKFVLTDRLEIPNVDLARDLLHFGIESNKQFSEKVLSII